MTVGGGKLFLDVPGRLMKAELLADSDSTFFIRSSGTPVAFGKDRGGKVTGIMIAGEFRGKKVR